MSSAQKARKALAFFGLGGTLYEPCSQGELYGYIGLKKKRERGMAMPKYPNVAVLGRRVHALREQRGLSLRALARKAQMPHNNLLNLERGELNPPFETLVRLAHALGLTVAELCEDLPLAQSGAEYAALETLGVRVSSLMQQQALLGKDIQGLLQELQGMGIAVPAFLKQSQDSGPEHYDLRTMIVAVA
jgi:transcriptional regulator with XRE-family HTH domain